MLNTYLYKAIPVVVAAIVALVAVRWVYFKILYIAKTKGLVDNPDARKLQKEPVPVTGGLAVFFGVAMGLLAGYSVGGLMGVEFQIRLMPVLVSMVVMLYIGAMDDIMGLSPTVRFVIEILTVLGLIYTSGGCIDTFHGLWGIEQFSWWIAVPLTVFAGVGIINAVNMIDGVNGLSSSLCMLCSIFYGFVFVRSGDVANATLAFSVAAALLPFMIHNIFGERSRMFIGDAGTMVMGILLTWFTICFLKSGSTIAYYDLAKGVNLIAFALSVLSVPIFDTIRVMLIRIAKRKSPFHPDQTHLHHVFINVGVSHIITTLTELIIQVLVVLIWLISVSMGASIEAQLYIVIATSIFFVWGTYVMLRYHVTHHTELLHKLTEFSIRTHLTKKLWWQRFSKWLDGHERSANIKELGSKSVQAFVKDETFIDPDNYKEQDRKKILDYMKGRAEVMVSDLIQNCGANHLRIYPIIFEEIQKGRILVIKTGYFGAPVIVTLNC